MLAALLSCTPPELSSSPTPEDTVREPPTPGEPLPHGGCGALVAPWPFVSAPDVVPALRLLLPDPTQADLLSDVALPRAEPGCPVRVSGSGSERLSGPCTTSAGDRWEGLAIIEDVTAYGRMNVRRWSYEAFSYTRGDGSLSFEADGTLAYMESAAPTFTETTSYWVRLNHDGSYPYARGEWFRHGMVTEAVVAPDQTLRTWSSYVYVVWDPAGTTTGDMCQSWDLVAACPGEPDGRVWLEGTASVEVEFDGSDRCDACLLVRLDGARTVCPDAPIWPR